MVVYAVQDHGRCVSCEFGGFRGRCGRCWCSCVPVAVASPDQSAEFSYRSYSSRIAVAVEDRQFPVGLGGAKRPQRGAESCSWLIWRDEQNEAGFDSFHCLCICFGGVTPNLNMAESYKSYIISGFVRQN